MNNIWRKSITLVFTSFALLGGCSQFDPGHDGDSVTTPSAQTVVLPLPQSSPNLSLTPTITTQPQDTSQNPTSPIPTGANQTIPIDQPEMYLDDRSSAAELVISYFNAINRKEYLRAYSYWRDAEADLESFERFQAGYEDTISVDVTLNQVTGDAGAGQFYYAVPALLEAETSGNQVQTYAACYVLHLANPGAQASIPFRSLAILRARAVAVVDGDDRASALADICSGPEFSSENPILTPQGSEAEVYQDNRSGPLEVLQSYINALNRKEYLRAFSYWEETDSGTEMEAFEQFERGFADTKSIELMAGEVRDYREAGNFFYSMPAVLLVRSRSGETQTYAGCYTFHLSNPATQEEPPFRPLAIRSADLEVVSPETFSNENFTMLLKRNCSLQETPDFLTLAQ
jgi:hypothetical protein